MALTFTEKFRENGLHRVHVIYEITHDGSTTDINASDLGLNYIDYVINHSTSMAGTAGPKVAFQEALSSGVVTILESWGY